MGIGLPAKSRQGGRSWTGWLSTITADCIQAWAISVRRSTSNAGMRHSVKRPRKWKAKNSKKRGQHQVWLKLFMRFLRWAHCARIDKDSYPYQNGKPHLLARPTVRSSLNFYISAKISDLNFHWLANIFWHMRKNRDVEPILHLSRQGNPLLANHACIGAH